MVVHFLSSLVRYGDDLEVAVSATVTRSSGFDDAGYGAGYLAEDVVAEVEGCAVELTAQERDGLAARAVEIFRNRA